MKGFHICKRILFFSILCLLWLPNYCDINENEANSPDVQTYQTLSNDPSRVENVPSKQKEETLLDQLKIAENVAVQPIVEYVNNLENEEVEKDRKSSTGSESFNEAQPSENYQQNVLNELESSRTNTEIKKDNSVKDETRVILEKEKSDFVHIPTESVPLSLVLTSPTVEPSVTKASVESTVKLMEAVHQSVSDSIELNIPDSSEKTVRVVNVESVGKVEPIKHTVEDSLPHQPHYDGMPSFDEWKKMMLAEQEKGGQKVPSPTPPGKKISSQKRRRNYSSYECGAKIVASNAEAEGTSRILNEKVDEYMLNPCKAKIWFVLELCESVQATQIELANFELFSSCPREFAVYSSDNFPTRDWVLLGAFTAAEQRVLQSFELKQEGFGKFIKIELLSYYGKEHYCPLSVVRIFGTSMVDEYEEMEMEKSASHLIIADDDLDRLDIPLEDNKPSNIFGSATDAVMSIVKKAAQALGQHQSEDIPNNETIPDSQNASASKLCKAKDNSSDKCEDIVAPNKSNKSDALQDLSASPSSTQRTLFHLLHRCDQCVPSRIRYYSSAQPHCRFFQAVFGPLVLQRLCDWFREHPLVFAHDSSARHKKVPSHDNISSPLPTKSPPPQIMVVPLENDLSIKTLFLKGNLSALNKTIMINATKTYSSVDISREVSNEEHLEASIPPTLSQELKPSTATNDTESRQTVQSAKEVSPDAPMKPTDTLSGEMSEKTDDRLPVETSSSDLPDVFTDSDEEQMKEFITASEDLPIPEIVASTEMPAGLKASEEREGRSDFQGRIEPVSISGVSTAGQKESVFMRMSNRIKSLELNMSLSSQYLQELSQRYRRQMEDMQRAFNRTIGTLNDTARKAAEKDIRQQEILNSLTLQVGNLTETVELLLNERSTNFRRMIETHVGLMLIEAIVMVTLMSLYVRRITASVSAVPPPKERETVVVSPQLSKRRSSVDSCSPPVARKVRKRSASEEGLNAGDQLLIVEPLPVLLDPILKAKKKNRKRSKVQRSISQPTVQRRNSSPPGQCTANYVSHSEGCMLKSVRPKHQFHMKNHPPCENCNNNVCSQTLISDKEKRLKNGTPFQNLTNGRLQSCQESPTKSHKKERFSFRKFLKFQKRDSI